MRSSHRLLPLTCPKWFGSIVGAIAVTAFARPPVYRSIEIPTLGGALNHANQVSDAGHVVGWSETGETNDQGRALHRAYLWKDGQLTDLGTLGGDESEASAVNRAGHVVGWAHTQFGTRHAFLWLAEPAFGLPAGMNDLGADLSTESNATDINEHSQVAGTFLWLPSPANGMSAGLHQLCGMSGCETGLGVGINNSMHIVADGGVWFPSPAYGRPAGWSYIGPLVTDFYFVGADLNDRGRIAAWRAGLGSPFLSIYDLRTGTEDLFHASRAIGLNEDGIVVGELYTVSGTRANYVQRGAIGLQHFFLAEFTLPRDGMTLTAANDISNNQQIVATGQQRAVLLVPIDTDLNESGGTSQVDFAMFADCMGSPGQFFPSFLCARADFERDLDIDLSDFQALQIGFTGSDE